MRDLNSSVARAVPRYQKKFPPGRLWARRYSAEYLPGTQDIEEQFFYTVLQPVQDGLADSIYEYRDYNCFEDAITGRTKEYRVIRWKEYNDARRWDKNVKVSDFTDIVELKFERLPGYEELSAEEYIKVMREKLVVRTAAILAARGGKPGAGAEQLAKVIPGSVPRNTKTSTATSHRPRVLSKDDARRAQGKDWYFSIYYQFKDASQRYRAGEATVQFPLGTYKPPAFTCLHSEPMD